MTAKNNRISDYPISPGKQAWKRELRMFPVGLVKLQKPIIPHDDRLLEVFERHDSGGGKGEQKKRRDYADKDHSLTHPTPDVVFTYAEVYLQNDKIALQGIRL